MQSSSYTKIWSHLLPSTQNRQAQWTYQFGVWQLSSLILLGMAVYKMRFFSGRYSRGRMLVIAVCSLAAGLIFGWFRLHFNQIALQDYGKYIDNHSLPFQFFFPFEIVLMGLGYCALIVSLLQARILKSAWRVFAKVGRMALTTYLMQSVICGIFFTGAGMGYYGRLEQHELYYVALEVCLVQSVFAVLWLRYFKHGPAEWMLRCLMHKKWIPNRTRKQEITESPIPLFS